MRTLFLSFCHLTVAILIYNIIKFIYELYNYHFNFIGSFYIPTLNGLLFLFLNLWLSIIVLLASVGSIIRSPWAWYLWITILVYSILYNINYLIIFYYRHPYQNMLKIIFYFIFVRILFVNSVEKYFKISYKHKSVFIILFITIIVFFIEKSFL